MDQMRASLYFIQASFPALCPPALNERVGIKRTQCSTSTST